MSQSAAAIVDTDFESAVKLRLPKLKDSLPESVLTVPLVLT